MRSSQPARVFERALRPFRLRLRTAAFVRHVPAACIVALVMLDAALLVLRPGLVAAALTCGAALTLAIVGAGIGALVTTPSLTDTARTIDGYFRLENRAVTALQFSDAPDPMSRLIVGDATRRLGGIPASRLPLGGAAPKLRWAAIATAAASVLLVYLTAGGTSVPLTESVGPTAASGSAAAGQALSRSDAGRAAGRGGAATRTSTSAQASPVPTRRMGPGNAATTRDAAGESRGATPGTTPSAGTDTLDRAVQPDRAIGEARRSLSASTSTSAPAAGGAGDGQGSAADASGAGRGGRNVAARSAGSGGVAGGALLGDRTTGRSGEQETTVDMAGLTARAASARAEAALGDQRVPPRLRAYVRDYFVAVRNQTGQ